MKHNDKQFFTQGVQPPRTLCESGWENRKGRGVQQGYICALNEKRFGFISEDGRNRGGIFFHQSEVKGTIPWDQLHRGTRVCFKVGVNDKGCVATEVSVIDTQV